MMFAGARSSVSLIAVAGQGQPLPQLGGQIITPVLQSNIQSALPQLLGPGTYSCTIQGLDTTGDANEVDVTGTEMQPPRRL